MTESDRGWQWRRWIVRSLIGLGLIAATAALWTQPWSQQGLTDELSLYVGSDKRHSPLMTGETVPIEQFASIMLGPTTRLARQTFVETAHGQDVAWAMRLVDLQRHGDGEVIGNFKSTVIFKSDDAQERRQLQFNCLFGESPSEQLLKLHVGDLAKVAGKLKLEERNWKDQRGNHPIAIENAKVVGVEPSGKLPRHW